MNLNIIGERYQVLEMLGEGGVGTTYKAKDLQTSQLIAIKVISFRQITDWKTVDLFEREVRVLKQLDLPTIPKYLDSFEIDADDDRLFCIVQALAPGKNLAQWMQEGWRPNEEDVKAIAQQLLEIFIYLQTLTPPIIHRDIKPQNILRDEQGQIYLVDFGAVQDTYRQTVTGGSTVIGTFGYMAPEQFRGQATLSTDLYGLGTTLVFLLTGKDPINLQQTEDLKLTIPSDLQITLPFRRWLQHLIEPAVEDRCPSAETAILFFQGQEELIPTEYQSILRPKNTNIQFIKTKDYLRIQFLPHNFLHPKVLKATFAGSIGIIYFLLIFLWLTFVGLQIPSFPSSGIIFLLLSIGIVSISVRALQILIQPTVVLANQQFMTLRGVLKPFQFYQEITFGLNYIDEVHLKKISYNITTCLIRTIEQQEFQFGDYLSISEQRWIVHEVQEFLRLAKNKAENERRENLKILTDKNVNALNILLTQGIFCYENNSINNSRNLFEAALVLNKTCSEAHNNLGVIQLIEGQYLAAIEAFYNALQLAPSYQAARVNLAIAYERQGNLQECVKTYATPCPVGQNQGEDNYTLIVASNTRQSLADAIVALQELNPCDGDLIEVRNSYAYLLHLQGNSEAAIHTYKDTLKFKKKNSFTIDMNADKKLHYKLISETYENLGWVLAMLGHREEALVNLKKSCSDFKNSESIQAQKINALINYYQQSEQNIRISTSKELSHL
jgi:eukaryotic-like serine/threonine-protein kinase